MRNPQKFVDHILLVVSPTLVFHYATALKVAVTIAREGGPESSLGGEGTFRAAGTSTTRASHATLTTALPFSSGVVEAAAGIDQCIG